MSSQIDAEAFNWDFTVDTFDVERIKIHNRVC